MDLTQRVKLATSPVKDLHRIGIYLVPLSLALALFLWELATRLTDYPAFILPPPGLVWERFSQVIRDGSLLRHVVVTLKEVLAGLALGVSAATV